MGQTDKGDKGVKLLGDDDGLIYWVPRLLEHLLVGGLHAWFEGGYVFSLWGGQKYARLDQGIV